MNKSLFKLSRFLISREFWKNLLIAGILTLVVITGIFRFMRIYTRHGQALAVPDLTGLTISEADSIILARELRFRISDSVYNTDMPRGRVVEQNPPPEFKVKKNRTIFITINAFNPEMVQMPDLVGISLRQAMAIIRNAGLRVGKLVYVPDIGEDNVLAQLHDGKVIETGDAVIRGSTVDLELGMGLSDQQTVVPDLHGLPLSEAREKILSRRLNLGALIYDGSVFDAIDSAHARVYRQRPDHEETELIHLGAAINIWLTVDSVKLGLADTTSVDTLMNNEVPF